MAAEMSYSSLNRPIFMPDSTGLTAVEPWCGYYNYHGTAEKSSKSQVFLRSYQFSRKRSLSERIRLSLVQVKRLVWFRLRSARKLRRFVWAKLSKLRQGFYGRRRPARLSDYSTGITITTAIVIASPASARRRFIQI